MKKENIDIIFSTAYLPPIEYFYQLTKYRVIYIDIFENYVKQTYRNRCYIYTANGKLCMSIPVIKTTGNHTKVKDVKIDYKQSWHRLHWRSIESAYNSSPFFLYFRDYLEPFYEKKYKFLIDLNTELLHVLIKLSGIISDVKFTENYIKPNEKINDFRNCISPKSKQPTVSSFSQYIQVFGDKHGFIPNLSIIDLLFNEGKTCNEYLL